MEIGRRLETQRLALLRLVAGWLAGFAVLYVVPLAPAWSRRVRHYLHGLLQDAEAAAQFLVIARAHLIAKARGGADWPMLRPALPLSAPLANGEEPPSMAELRARLRALRFLLRNLPRHGLRKLRRMAGDAPKTDTAQHKAVPTPSRDCHTAVSRWSPPRPWHPPDPGRLPA